MSPFKRLSIPKKNQITTLQDEFKTFSREKFLNRLLQRKALLEVQLEELNQRYHMAQKMNVSLTQKFYKEVQNLALKYSHLINEKKEPVIPDSHRKEMERLKTRERNLLARIHTLETEYQTQEKVLQKITDELADYKNKIDDGKNWIDSMEREYKVALNVISLAEKTIDEQKSVIDTSHLALQKQNEVISTKEKTIQKLREDLRLTLLTIDEKKDGLNLLATSIRSQLVDFDKTLEQHQEDLITLRPLPSPQEKTAVPPVPTEHIFDRQPSLIKKGRIVSVGPHPDIIYVNLGQQDGLLQNSLLFIEKEGQRIASAQPIFLREHLSALRFSFLPDIAPLTITTDDIIIFEPPLQKVP